MLPQRTPSRRRPAASPARPNRKRRHLHLIDQALYRAKASGRNPGMCGGSGALPAA